MTELSSSDDAIVNHLNQMLGHICLQTMFRWIFENKATIAELVRERIPLNAAQMVYMCEREPRDGDDESLMAIRYFSIIGAGVISEKFGR